MTTPILPPDDGEMEAFDFPATVTIRATSKAEARKLFLRWSAQFPQDDISGDAFIETIEEPLPLGERTGE